MPAKCRILICLLLPVGLAGCMSAPKPSPQMVAGADASWISAGPAGSVDAQWWSSLSDPKLDALIDTALKASPDIKEAEARFRAARAQNRAAAAGELPRVGTTASAARSRQTLNGLLPIAKLPGLERDNTLFDVGFDANWELDLWGGARSATAASAARTKVAMAQAAGVRLQVIAEVVRNYASLRSAQARQSSLAAELALLSQLAALERQRAEEGEVNRDAALAAQQRLDALRATSPALDIQIHGYAFNLAVLTRQPPEAMLALAGEQAAIPQLPQAVLIGLRSELLQRRPDVRAAEADLAAYTADIGVARAAFFPRISLMGEFGQQARGSLDLLSASSTRFSAGPTLSWPIFAAGAIRAQWRGAKAESEAAGERYAKAVLSALADSENAANHFAQAKEAETRQESAHHQAVELAGLAESRADAGETSRLELLEAQVNAQEANRAVIGAKGDAVEAWITLCKSLGGGW